MNTAFQILRGLIWAGLLSAFAMAQSAEDPAKRAMEKIEAAVGERSTAAERALEAVRWLRESTDAKKQGNPKGALDALAKAELLATDAEESQQSELIVALLRRINDERETLSPTPVPLATAAATAADENAVRFAPRVALARYQAYREPLSRILIEENLPPELLAVALVESGFNPLALSPKGARGIWQLMPATAAAYGLNVGPSEDHRTHPERSTRAAARYLRDLYARFGDWKLALAAYNWGEGRVQRALAKTGARNFDELARRARLPLETRQYVPAVMAVWAQLRSNGTTTR